jgi:imidazolonepropionase-like amidohydrolase
MTIHSDAGARFTAFERFDRSLEVMVKGLPVAPAEAIRAATEFAADSMGIAGEVGTLEVGKRADALVLDENPLDDISNIRTIHAVLRDGRVLVDRGRIAPHGLSPEPVQA